MPSASDPIDPERVLSAIGRFRSTINRALATEEELDQSRRARHLKLSREITAREQSDLEALDASLKELNYQHELATWKEQKSYDNRKTRINQAYHASRASLSKRLQDKKDARVSATQHTILAQRKIHQRDVDEAVAAHRAFQEKLLSDRETRDQLRDQLLKNFRSFRPLFESLFLPHPSAPAADDETPEALRASAASDIDAAREAVELSGRLPAARIFRLAPLWLVALIVTVVGFVVSKGPHAWWISLVTLYALLWLAASFQARPIARRAANALCHARAKAIAAEKKSAATVTDAEAKHTAFEKEQNNGLNQTFHETDTEFRARVEEGQRQLQQKMLLLPDRAQDLHRRRMEKIDHAHRDAVASLNEGFEKKSKARSLARVTSNHATDAIVEASIAKLEGAWKSDVVANREELSALEPASLAGFPAWTQQTISSWSPATGFPQAIRIGRLEVSPKTLPASPLFTLPGSAGFSAPFALGFPRHGSLLIESEDGSSTANAVLNAISLRILSSLPPGRASFLFIDPVSLGRDFAGLMHLADYEETLINQRIWTQSSQIEERLAEINAHIEKVIQMYLRNEYSDIAEYNAQPGTVAEKYHFIVISGLPSGFTDVAAKRLRSIASSGARCGVHLLVHHDLRQPSHDPALDAELRNACLHVTLKDDVFRLGEDSVVFDSAPAGEYASDLIHRIGRASVDSNRVEVPFAQIAPEPDEIWSLDTSDELRVPIGRSGAKKLQMLALGKGTRQHALVAGKTGSGKSTLFHVIISNLALWCSPDRVEFYLIDFKKGVEFKCYADHKLPHARVIAIESDRQFALSVLQRVDAELKRRGDLFRKAGSQDLSSYNRSGEKPLPRTLLLVDEFQEFFTEEDATAQQASLLLDRIVRQGRAFGIHVILGSQTLGGAYSLARATLGQMAVRIALQCNETDAHLIMDEENPAPRMLTRPGEGIYNDQSGAASANSPFQIVWLPENERDSVLSQIHDRAESDGNFTTPLVFEGNAPADIRENTELAAFLKNPPTARPASASMWLGAPNSIKGPTAAIFKRQTGSNLLVISQSPEQADSVLAGAVISLAAQFPEKSARLFILDPFASENNSLLLEAAGNIPHEAQTAGPMETATLLEKLSADLKERESGAAEHPEIFLIIRDIQRFKVLRPDDDFRFSYDDSSSASSPSQILSTLLGEGGPAGIHVIASIDGWNNVSRWIPRKLLAEFEMRVLFQMSAADSANLIDSPDASALGLHRALLHNEHLGTLETFRPYASFQDV